MYLLIDSFRLNFFKTDNHMVPKLDNVKRQALKT